MKIINRKEPWLLFIGDILIFVASLWLALLLRFGAVPSRSIFLEHLIPFSILFLIWFVVFFIAGLYEKQTVVSKKSLPNRLINTQVFNSFLAVVFFYIVPYFGITPKTILFIYLIVYLGLFFVWRTYGQRLFTSRQKDSALIIGQGQDINLLSQEINNNPRYDFKIIKVIDPREVQSADFTGVSIVVADLENKNIDQNLPNFYKLLFSGIRFVDINVLYEEIFDRIPVSMISYKWFLDNLFLASNISYDVIKRLGDVVISIVAGLISLVFYPFIILAIKLGDGGPIFIAQDRVGKNNLPITIIKFRTMSFNDNEEVVKAQDNKITRVGRFLRVSRLDELPQLWNILKGDLSLVGPRPELPALTQIYEKEVPYYNVRHLIKPGLSGWAQIYQERHPHQGVDTLETQNKLSYDLYYVKNRSLLLDLKITLKTLKTLISRTGR